MNLKIFGFFLLLLLTYNLAAQTTSPYKEVDALVKSFPLNPKSAADVKVLQNELKRLIKTEDELARAAFVWISSNIAYDCEGLKRNAGLHNVDDVLSNKRAICAGYAALYKHFCDGFGLECKIITGYSISYNDKLPANEDSLKSNHAWNAVKVNGTWKLIDATWGSGWSVNNCESFRPEFKEYFFYADPKELIKDHFPMEMEWQLLEKPLSGKQFIDSVRQRREDERKRSEEEMKTYEEEMKTYGEVIVEKPDSIIRKQIGQIVRFTFTTKDTANSVIVWSDGRNGIYHNGKPVVTQEGYYFDYEIKKAGRFRVYVSIFNDHGEPELTPIQINEYILDVKKAIPPAKAPAKPVPKK